MSKNTITITMYDDNGDEMEMNLPARFDVCPSCDGHGTHLVEGMREHAYSMEEFNESFDDDDDRAAYFERGGKYDVTCTECGGKRVVLIVDEAQCTPEELAAYESHMQEEADFRAEQRAERRMGC